MGLNETHYEIRVINHFNKQNSFYLFIIKTTFNNFHYEDLT
jgi:hypothetical protein